MMSRPMMIDVSACRPSPFVRPSVHLIDVGRFACVALLACFALLHATNIKSHMGRRLPQSSGPDTRVCPIPGLTHLSIAGTAPSKHTVSPS